MTDNRLPMVVIGGYLGAGKTTLINRILAEPQGRRVMVLVNDFGAINIDADLLQSASVDTLTLTNGCVCCTMGNDLFLAISEVLKRRPRPDCLIVEASGIADPGKIANAAVAEPDMRYGGIVTVVDAENFQDLLTDDLIAPQIRSQTACADLVAVSKTETLAGSLRAALEPLTRSQPVLADDMRAVTSLLLAPDLESTPPLTSPGHPGYERWQYSGQRVFDRAELTALLQERPPGMFRAKGFVRSSDGGGWTVQVVGKNISLTPTATCPKTVLVGIGLRSGFDKGECQHWWNGLAKDRSFSRT